MGRLRKQVKLDYFNPDCFTRCFLFGGGWLSSLQISGASFFPRSLSHQRSRFCFRFLFFFGLFLYAGRSSLSLFSVACVWPSPLLAPRSPPPRRPIPLLPFLLVVTLCPSRPISCSRVDPLCSTLTPFSPKRYPSSPRCQFYTICSTARG